MNRLDRALLWFVAAEAVGLAVLLVGLDRNW